MKASDTINILGLSVILGLSFLGCSDKNGESANNNSEISSSIEHSAHASDTNSENSSGNSFVESSDSEPAITAPMSYASPWFKVESVYYSPETYDYSDYCEFNDLLVEDEDSLPPPTESFEVKVGDTLENGLVVSDITTYPTSDTKKISFSGELTMEGIIYLVQQDHDYIIFARDLEFFPDCNQNAYIPGGISEPRYTMVRDDSGNWLGIRTGCEAYFLGNIDDTDVDEREIFGDSTFAKVRVTVKNIVINRAEDYDSRPKAEIADIELID